MVRGSVMAERRPVDDYGSCPQALRVERMVNIPPCTPCQGRHMQARQDVVTAGKRSVTPQAHGIVAAKASPGTSCMSVVKSSRDVVPSHLGRVNTFDARWRCK